MAKIHTHYDNLKVARLAPQEVIRAAYKALSQKYHPDKNPGDEKAARIMAIINSAYGTLSDAQRRKEHDEWIAAEEWEIEWLESTRAEDRDRQRDHEAGWAPEPVDMPKRYRAARDPKWWFGLVGVFGVGCVAGALMTSQPALMSVALASASSLGATGDAKAAQAAPATAPRTEPHAAAPAHAEGAADGWAVTRASLIDGASTRAPEVRALSVSQLHIAPRPLECDGDPRRLVAPNGEQWPAQSAYVDGYPVANKGEDMQLTVDNSANPSPVFAKVFDLDQRVSVRSVYVLAHDTMVVSELATGKYELRYQNIDAGADKADCDGRKDRLAQQAAALAE